MTSDAGRSSDRQGKTAALVVAGAGAIWLLFQYLGARYGIPVRFMFLIDFLAMAAMVWAVLVALRIWRSRQSN